METCQNRHDAQLFLLLLQLLPWVPLQKPFFYINLLNYYFITYRIP